MDAGGVDAGDGWQSGLATSGDDERKKHQLPDFDASRGDARVVVAAGEREDGGTGDCPESLAEDRLTSQRRSEDLDHCLGLDHRHENI